MNELLKQWDAIGHPHILVLGDIILDRYTWGDVERVSPEAPVLVIKTDQHEVRLGGAASVAGLLRSLEANVTLAGVIGNDANGHVVQKLLEEAGIDAELVFCDESRPTTSKQRLIGRADGKHPHQVLRIDDEAVHMIERDLQTRLIDGITARFAEFDAVIVSDYAKGVCRSGTEKQRQRDKGPDSGVGVADRGIHTESRSTLSLLHSVIGTANELGVPVLVDPARLANMDCYRGATLLKPNRLEAELAIGYTIESPNAAMQVGEWMCERLELQAVGITLDRDGMVVSRRAGPSEHFPAEKRAVCDITGAGDTAIAVLGLALASAGGNPLGEFQELLTGAVRLANIASGLQIEQFGVSPVCRREIRANLLQNDPTGMQKLTSLEQLAVIADQYRREGKKIVFTNGCFDLLHVGHLTCLQAASKFGDVLIVAINSDDSVRRLKGAERPVISQADRAALLAGLECVDHVLVFDEPTPHELLRRLRPDVLVKGLTTSEVVGRDVVEAYGGKVCVAGYVEGVSTTRVIQKSRLRRLNYGVDQLNPVSPIASQFHQQDR
ncbi:MAG: bifunctional heptose 7-phosphate kinase/heptose 1-phosphate adenyltransferase [Planctomycetes bacterium]|nr:bifunctional heptose 7-phosphate kinase/heptose 1-phosphate adenyltransferase [Planctomycetota bacterium]